MNARLAGGIFLFILLISVTLKGQWVKPEFDNIGIEEKNLKQCSFDKQADAVVLFDSGESFFIDGSNGIEMVFVKHIKIKIYLKPVLVLPRFRFPCMKGNRASRTSTISRVFLTISKVTWSEKRN